MYNDDLIKMCKAGNLDMAKLLLDNGADVHARDDDALRYASLNGHTDIVKLLIDNGADIHACNDDALILASYYGHTEVVKLLMPYYL